MRTTQVLHNNITEPLHSAVTINENPDVYVLRDIFTAGDQLYRAGTCKFEVSAEEYSPLIVKHGSDFTPYILTDPNKKYLLEVVYSGSVLSTFGGSAL